MSYYIERIRELEESLKKATLSIAYHTRNTQMLAEENERLRNRIIELEGDKQDA